MINFRFHIVSLTAVLLALGVGLVLGTTFLDDATVNQLRNQLDGLEADLDRAQARNDELSGRLDTFEDEAAQLDEQLGERLYGGQLEGDPVLVVSTRGVDSQWTDDVLVALGQADADVVGVWWLTDRLALDDESEVSDLSSALELSTDDADRLRRNLAVQLADVLFGAVDAPDGGAPDLEGPAEPALLGRLREAGFVEYDLPDGSDGDVVALPAAGLRIVVVDGPGASLPPGDIVLPVLADLSSGGPVPVVATQPTPTPDEDESADGDPPPPPLVAEMRDNDDLAARMSTVDDLDRVSGRIATLLATVDAVPGAPVVGHYGTGDGADRLLPPAAGTG
jgi:Copper transport outer membrane protein, MctB